MFLTLMKSGRTARCIVLSSPILQATFCVHRGLGAITAAPRLVMPPWAFMTLFLAGRLLLDLHLHTIFRGRLELQWARKEVLLSTRSLVAICVGMFLLENLGFMVVTYIKLLVVPLFYALSSAGFLAPAAYVVAFTRSKKVCD